MKAVFGEGKVTDYFAPTSSAKPGSKTRDAQQQLNEARKSLNDLDVVETTWKEAKTHEARQVRFTECAGKRLAAKRKIDFVYEGERYKGLQRDETLRMLNFENDSETLWKRIGQASLFVDFVFEAKQRITDRIARLSTELHERTSNIKGFPINIFTRSLEKIGNILEGSIGTREPEGSTQRLQYVAPGTLAHALQELRVGQATEKLAQLAEEVGVRLDGDSVLSLDEITGSIIQNFHDVVKEYQRERQRLDGLTAQLTALGSELTGSPEDFEYPPTLPQFSELQARPALIESELSETLAEEVERLITEHDNTCRLGNFQPLMTAAKELLTGPKSALGRLAGQVATLENAVTGYRQKLLNSDQLRATETAYNALLKVQRKPPEKPLDMADLKRAGSLKAAKELVTVRCADWPAQGERILAGTSVPFELWANIVRDVSSGNKPALTNEQSQKLVEKGFLEVTYRLGGGA